MAAAGKLAGAGKTRGSRPNHRDRPARWRRWLDDRGRSLAVAVQSVGIVHGIALQPADHDRLMIRPEHARAFAEFLDRADAGAGGSQQVCLEDRARGAGQIIRSRFF